MSDSFSKYIKDTIRLNLIDNESEEANDIRDKVDSYYYKDLSEGERLIGQYVSAGFQELIDKNIISSSIKKELLQATLEQ